MKIAICIPCHGDPKFKFVASLVDLITYSAPHHSLGTMMHQGHLLDGRNWLVEQALKFGAERMLWLDADHTFPRDALERLLSHDLDVVGCNYPMRADPGNPTAAIGDVRVLTTEAKAEAGMVERVETLGLGVCLMRPTLFELLPKPWFTFVPVPGKNIHMSEDVQLFQRLGTKGVQAHVDHALSWQVTHLHEQCLTNGEVANVHSNASSSGSQ